MYSFVDHLHVTGDDRWKARIRRWKRDPKGARECLLSYVRKRIFPKEKARRALFKKYRNAVIDHDVVRDTRLEYQLYGRLPKVQSANADRKRAREIWTRHRGAIKDGYEIDHIDCDPRNNRLSNLRKLTRRQHIERHRKPCPGRRKKKPGLRVPDNVVATPENRRLYRRAYATVKAKLKLDGRRWSAYASQQLVRTFKALGGRYKRRTRQARDREGLSRWFREKWIDVCTGRPCGRAKGIRSKRTLPYCRPSIRVSSKTPALAADIGATTKRKICRRRKAYHSRGPRVVRKPSKMSMSRGRKKKSVRHRASQGN